MLLGGFFIQIVNRKRYRQGAVNVNWTPGSKVASFQVLRPDMSGDVWRHAVPGFLVAAGRFAEVFSRGASGPFKPRPGPLSDGQERAGRARHYRSRLPMGAC